MSKLKLQPQGSKLLVKEIDKPDFVTESGIIALDQQLGYAIVVELSPDFKDVYKQGDTILIPKNVGISQHYNGSVHSFIDGKGQPYGDVWAVVSEAKQGNDKGDGL